MLASLAGHTSLTAAGRLRALTLSLALTRHLPGHLRAAAIRALTIVLTTGVQTTVTGSLACGAARLTRLLAGALSGCLTGLHVPTLLTTRLAGRLRTVTLLALGRRLGRATAVTSRTLLTAGCLPGRTGLTLTAGLAGAAAGLLTLLSGLTTRRARLLLALLLALTLRLGLRSGLLL